MVDLIKYEPSKLDIQNYHNYNDINKAYHDFIQKIMDTTDKVTSRKKRQIKQKIREWFDGKIADEIKNGGKFRKFKKSKLHLDKDIYHAARYKLQK